MGNGDELLDGGWQTRVTRVGDTVVRSARPSSEAVVASLKHLESVGFAWSPRPVETGFDESGNEVLSFIEGASPQPYAWSDDGVAQVGAMLRELHIAASNFDAPTDAPWLHWWARDLGDSRGIGHGDLGPWNIMAIDETPSGFIDWDTAGPVDPVWELAQVAWLNAHLHDDDLAQRLGLGDVASRARQLALIVDGYRLDKAHRTGFVDKMIEYAIHSARADAVEYDVSPETRSGIGDDGFPFVWGITWRTRSASWMLRNKAALERAIT